MRYQRLPRDANSCSCIRIVLFLSVVVICCFTSGGLITGVGPFVMKLHREQYLEHGAFDQLSAVVNGGFQLMAFGTCLSVYAMDRLGPRSIAIVSLVVLITGELTLAYATPQTTRLTLLLGYGMIGAGGTSFYMSCFSFCKLFETPAIAVSILASTFNCAGMVFMVFNFHLSLTFVFNVLCAIAFFTLGFVTIVFPDTPYAKGDELSLGVRWKTFCGGITPTSTDSTELKEILHSRQFWLFALSFSWSALCNIVVASLFDGLVEAKATELERHQGTVQVMTNYVFPLGTNVTFLVNPWIGRVIEKKGFWMPAFFMAIFTQLTLLSCFLPTLWSQLSTVWCLLVVNALAYNLQVSYITLVYPASINGAILAATIFIQALVGLIGWPILSPNPFGKEAFTPVLLLLLLPTPMLYVWSYYLYSRKS